MKLVFVPLKDVFKECKGKRQFSIKKDAYRRFSSVSNEMQIGIKKIAALYGLDEIFTRAHGRPARTFPVQFPLLRLDRIYVKNASASAPTALPLRTWRHLSDHAPLSAEIHL